MAERPVVLMSWAEIYLGGGVGVLRRCNGLRENRRDKFETVRGEGWNGDVNGALTEMAVAKHYGAYWDPGVGKLDLPDVGKVGVRSKVKPEHRLVVWPHDPDDRPMILVEVVIPSFVLWGWLHAGDAKRPEWLDPEGKLHRWFVPNHVLHPMSELTSCNTLPAWHGMREVDQWLTPARF